MADFPHNLEDDGEHWLPSDVISELFGSPNKMSHSTSPSSFSAKTTHDTINPHGKESLVRSANAKVGHYFFSFHFISSLSLSNFHMLISFPLFPLIYHLFLKKMSGHPLNMVVAHTTQVSLKSKLEYALFYFFFSYIYICMV